MKKPLSSNQVEERIERIRKAMEDEHNPIKKTAGVSALVELVESTVLCIHLLAEGKESDNE